MSYEIHGRRFNLTSFDRMRYKTAFEISVCRRRLAQSPKL